MKNLVEKITLYGGPQHGVTVAIPADGRNEYRIERLPEPHAWDEDDRIEVETHTGAYTRIHTIFGTATSDFEWSGWKGRRVTA